MNGKSYPKPRLVKDKSDRLQADRDGSGTGNLRAGEWARLVTTVAASRQKPGTTRPGRRSLTATESEDLPCRLARRRPRPVEWPGRFGLVRASGCLGDTGDYLGRYRQLPHDRSRVLGQPGRPN